VTSSTANLPKPRNNADARSLPIATTPRKVPAPAPWRAVRPRDGTRDAMDWQLRWWVGGDPALHEDIEKVAKALSLSNGTKVREHARETTG